MNTGPLLLLASVGVAAAIVAGRRSARLWQAGLIIAAVSALSASIEILLGGTPWIWRGSFAFAGEATLLRLDAISALFLALLSVVGSAGTLYAQSYWPTIEHPRSAGAGRVWWALLLGSLGFVLLAANGLHFLFGWEIFTVSSYFLITLDRQKAAVRAAGWLYLGASHAATLSLFAFFALLASHLGSWELGPMHGRAELAPLFWLALFAFGLKAGMFPLHIWLPSAHANAPSHVSAIMSGVTIKLGIYGIVRFSGWMDVPVSAGWIIVGLGTISAVLGVAFALGQHDLKRLLAYHSVENIGIILIGVGFGLVAQQEEHAAWGQIALAGGLLHVWNHGLFKALLFLGAGAVLHATRTREMSRLGGLWRGMPWTATLFGLGAVAISGLPPLNGFVSEWLVYLGLFDAVNTHRGLALGAIGAAVMLGITGALALACFVKVCGVVFLGAPRSAAAERAHECAPSMRWPMAGLAIACLAIGLAPAVFWPAIARATAVWDPTWANLPAPASLPVLGALHVALALSASAAAVLIWSAVRARGLRRAVTWDCGYVSPSSRIQYTAGSFAATITEWFAWILRPQQHREAPGEPFPSHARHESHTPETVLDFIVAPCAGRFLRLAELARRLQHGRIQAYLFYLAVGAAALALIVFFSPRP
jgi:hydrogenase-4 component B